MFVLRFMLKLTLVPVWLALLLLWLPVHLLAGICGALHGLGKLVFSILALIAVILGMWQNALVFAAFVAGSFGIVLFAAILDAVLEETRHIVGALIG